LKCGLWRKPRRWVPLTRDTRKGIKRVQYNEDFFIFEEQLFKNGSQTWHNDFD